MMNEKNEMRANGTAVNIGISVCPGCGRHCPVDALSCGRGMNIVRRLAAGDTLEQIREDARKEHGGKLEGDDSRHGEHQHVEEENGDRDRHGHYHGDYRNGGAETGDRHDGHGHHHGDHRNGGGEKEDGQDGHDHRHGGLGSHHGGCRREQDEDSLMGLLRTCGHYLYHHSGQSRTQDRVLRLLSERGELSQKELREVLNTKPGSISELISKLEAKGLIVSQRDETDRRQVNLRLTDDGRERASILAEAKEEEATFDALTSEEQETLKALLRKLVNSWR